MKGIDETKLNLNREEFNIGASFGPNGYKAFIRNKNTNEELYSERFNDLDTALHAASRAWRELTGDKF